MVPLKKYVNAACDGWMKSHPGKTMTIYDLPGILKEALPHAKVTPRNIQRGFQVSGMYPFNRNIFGNEEFLPGYVTDRSMVSTESNIDEDKHEETVNMPLPSLSNRNCEHVPGPIRISSFPDPPKSPEFLRPFPKGGPRKKV